MKKFPLLLQLEFDNAADQTVGLVSLRPFKPFTAGYLSKIKIVVNC